MAALMPANSAGAAEQTPVAVAANENPDGNYAPYDPSDEAPEEAEMVPGRGPRQRRRKQAMKSLGLLYFWYGMGLGLITIHCVVYITANDTKVGGSDQQETYIRHV